jgi:hypothetical protein
MARFLPRALALSATVVLLAHCSSDAPSAPAQGNGLTDKPACEEGCFFQTTVALGAGETTPVSRTPYSSGATVFTVTNVTSTAGVAHISCSAAANISCTDVEPASLSLGAMQSRNVTASWTVGYGNGFLYVSSDAGGTAIQKNQAF